MFHFFFFRQTQFKNLSVRALYKYVIKAVTIGTTEKRTAIGHGSRQSRRHHHHHHSSKKQHTTQPDNKQDNENNNSGDSDSSSSSSSGSDDSDSSDNENNDGDNNADKEEDQDGLNSALLGSKDRKTSKDSSSSMEGKSVSFGGPEGPVPLVTAEHPPQIPGVPIAKEEEDRRNNPTNEQQQSTVSPVDDTIADDITEDAIPAPPQETHGTVTYRERLGGYLHPRDMRRLVTPFSASNEPEMIVRRHVILLNVDPLRAVILRDRLLVLVPDGADSLLVDLEKRVRGGSKEIERDIFGESTDPSPHESMADIADSQHSRQSGTSSIKGMVKGSVGMVKGSVSLLKQTLTTNPIKTLHDRGGNTLQSSLGRGNSSVASSENDSTAGVSQTDISEFREWEEMEGRDWIDLPFELQCLDAVLGSVCAILGKDAGELRTNSINAMENLLNKGSGQGEDILRHMKNSIKEMSSRVHGFIRAMNLVLDETEDMALMNLSRLLTHPERFIQPVPEEILNEGKIIL